MVGQFVLDLDEADPLGGLAIPFVGALARRLFLEVEAVFPVAGGDAGIATIDAFGAVDEHPPTHFAGDGLGPRFGNGQAVQHDAGRQGDGGRGGSGAEESAP